MNKHPRTPRAAYSHGYDQNGQRVEWWNIYLTTDHKFVRIVLDPEWFRREGSINDLKELAFEAAA